MKIVFLTGVILLAGLTTSAGAAPGQDDPSCNPCLRLIRTEIAQVQQSVAQVQQGVTQANQTLGQIVAVPPPQPPAVMKKSAVVMEFGTNVPKPTPPMGANPQLPRANQAAADFCKTVNYGFGKALSFDSSVPPPGTVPGYPVVQVTRLVCFD